MHENLMSIQMTSLKWGIGIMIYLESNSCDANFNFALEAYAMYELPIAEEYFIFWRTQPTLMIGQYQNALQEINTEFVNKNNINVVRRVTGGGTIYTDMEGWQFSFISKNAQTKDIDFHKFTLPIINALKSIGVEAYQSGRNDLLIDGRKFSGNAQYIRGDLILHHGSLLFNTNIDNLVKALCVDDEKIISKGIKSVRQRVTNISEYIEFAMTSNEFKDLILKFLLKDMQKYTLTSEDIKKINKIKESKFESWDWNFGKTPQFNITREGRFAGGKLTVCSFVKNGIIEDVNFYGDFFAKDDINKLKDHLKGCKYERQGVEKILIEKKVEDFFYNISRDNILDLIFK